MTRRPNDDDDGSLPKGRFIGFYAPCGRDEWGGFLLPSSQTIVQGRYTVASRRFH